MQSKPKPQPTQASLKRILKGIARRREECVKVRCEKARKRKDDAVAALEEFERKNKEYRKLARAVERARTGYYKAVSEAREESYGDVTRLTTLVDLHGTTPGVIKEVEKVAKKYGLI